MGVLFELTGKHYLLTSAEGVPVVSRHTPPRVFHVTFPMTLDTNNSEAIALLVEGVGLTTGAPIEVHRVLAVNNGTESSFEFYEVRLIDVDAEKHLQCLVPPLAPVPSSTPVPVKIILLFLAEYIAIQEPAGTREEYWHYVDKLMNRGYTLIDAMAAGHSALLDRTPDA